MTTVKRSVVDFDHHSPEYAKDPRAACLRLRAEAGAPLAYSEHHGGFWIALDYSVVKQIASDDATFSSRHDLPNGSTPYLGINLPETPFSQIPIELDPPELTKWRKPMNPWFAPPAVERWRPKMVEYSTWFLDQRIESGEIDFVADLASPVPAILTLEMLGIPLERWREFSEATHAQISFPAGSPERADALRVYEEIINSVRPVAQERRRNPKDDFLSHLVGMEVDGRPVTDDEIVKICVTVVGGGSDTTMSLVASALHYLGDHPDERQRLIDDPRLIASACEEFLRYFSPVQMLARTATRDVEIAGQLIRAGDRVLISWQAANMDSSVFDCPEQIVLDRSPNRHAALGFGAHTCIGGRFGRVDFSTMIEQVLTRMPDFEILEGYTTTPSAGVVWAYLSLPARFTPGPRSGLKSSLDDL